MRPEGHHAFAIGVALWFAFLPGTDGVYAQPVSDEKVVEQSLGYAIQTLPASQLGLYNGRDYTPTTVTAGGHPFFLTEDLVPETIIYDGIVYPEVNLLFDAARQTLVIEDYAGNRICPVPGKIEMFTLGGHTFKRLSTVRGLSPGFYDVLFDKKASMFVRRSKSVKGLQWRTSNVHYFFNDSRLFILTNKKSLLESMRDKEADIRQYIRVNKLSFGKAREASLIRAVTFYSSLKQE